MDCSKYNLTNTGDTITYFNYRKCDDNSWQYQTPLMTQETKTIWLVNGSYSTAFNTIVVEDEGAFES